MSQLRSLWAFCRRHDQMLFFVGGFLFDAITLVRIDSVLDLLLQSVYLLIITWLIILQVKQEQGLWEPHGWLAKMWHYQIEALHFFYGGLLSAYTIFYFKSTTISRSAIFLGLTIALLFINEMPQVRKAGHRLRLGLHAFCLASFLNYLLPVLVGRMGAWLFALAIALSAWGSWALVKYLAKFMPNPELSKQQLGLPVVLVLFILVVLYVMKWIPPVPLSLQYGGVYHHVVREGDHYRLAYRKPAWYRFYRKDDRPFLYRSGDQLNCFVRIFGPRRFSHQVFLQWSLKTPSGRWQVSDRVPLSISGGRGDGYRGVATKSNVTPGRWRIDVQTEDERTLGAVTFEVVNDPSTDTPTWAQQRM